MLHVLEVIQDVGECSYIWSNRSETVSDNRLDMYNNSREPYFK